MQHQCTLSGSLVRSAVLVAGIVGFGSVVAADAEVKGQLVRPEGNGPFPAVVLLHGCSGIEPAWGAVWSKRLRSWGYVTFEVDSFGPRGITNICDTPIGLGTQARSHDAHAAKGYLQSLPYIEPGRVGVMGMSGGGETALRAVQNSYIDDGVRDDPFGAAVALYPHCEQQLYRVDAPILVLAAGQDDWTPAGSCERMAVDGVSHFGVQVHVYEDASHAFDMDLPRVLIWAMRCGTTRQQHWMQSGASRNSSSHIFDRPPSPS